MGLQTAAAAARTAQFVRQVTLADTAFATLLREDGHAVADVPLARRHPGAGETLVDEGQPAPALCFLADGWACRYVTTPDGRRQVSRILLPGDVCNLDAGVAERSGHGVRMLTPGTVLTLPLRAVCALRRDAGFAWAMARLALAENAALAQAALRLARFSARERLLALLCELSHRLGHNEASTASFALPMTQELLGDALGLTAVHVNRMVQALRREGLLSAGQHQIVVADVSALRAAMPLDLCHAARGAPAH